MKIIYKTSEYPTFVQKAFDRWSEKWISFILSHPDIDWAYEDILCNENLEWNIYKRYEHLFQEFQHYIHYNPNITMKIVKENPDFPWDGNRLSYNESMSWNVVLSNPYINWDWERLAMSIWCTPKQFVSASFHIQHKFLDCYEQFVINPNVDANWMRRVFNRPKQHVCNVFMDTEQQMCEAAENHRTNTPCRCDYNSHATGKIIDMYPDLTWDYDLLSSNKNITFEYIRKHLDKPWNWRRLSYNTTIPLWFILQNPTKDWSRCFLKHIDFHEITEHYDEIMSLPCMKEAYIFHWIEMNPSLSWEIALAYPQFRWSYPCIASMSDMSVERHKYVTKELQQWFMNSDLKQELMSVLWHPSNLPWLYVNGHDVYDENMSEMEVSELFSEHTRIHIRMR